MKQAAISRLARDPVGVELEVVIPPTMHWHANMAVAPTAMESESGSRRGGGRLGYYSHKRSLRRPTLSGR